MAWLLAPLALLIERSAGYPRPLFKLIGHPVVWMGALIGWLELRLNTGEKRRLKGVAMLVLLLLTGLAASLLIIAVTRRLPFGFVLEAVLARRPAVALNPNRPARPKIRPWTRFWSAAPPYRYRMDPPMPSRAPGPGGCIVI